MSRLSRDRKKPILDVNPGAIIPPIHYALESGSTLPPPVWDLDFGNLDGSNNGTLADSSLIGSAVNHGSGTDFVQATAGYKPTLSKGTGPNGVDVGVFNASHALEATNSASEISCMNNSAEWQFVFVVNKTGAGGYRWVGNSKVNTEEGFQFFWTNLDRYYPIQNDGAGGYVFLKQTIGHTPKNTWLQIWMRGQGAGANSYQISLDGSTWFDDTTIASPPGGNLLRDAWIGGLNIGTGVPDTPFIGEMARVWFWDGYLADSDNSALSAQIAKDFGL